MAYVRRSKFGGYRSQPVLACRFVNRVVTASDSVDTSRMERQVLCACVGPQRTLCPGGGLALPQPARRFRPRGMRPLSGGFTLAILVFRDAC